MAEAVLVTGGAGYIGSVVAHELLQAGREVVVYDNFVKGHPQAVPAGCTLIEGALDDGALLEKALRDHRVGAVMHFAAFSEAGLSMVHPERFFRNNVAGTLSLLEAMLRAGVGRLVFSSTAAVYGTPEVVPITEEAPLNPENAYGETKVLVERMLGWFQRIHGLKSASLRYFNAAGNTPERGEHHDPETHLIPILLDVAVGLRENVALFGTDYPTPDGTCIRDYIHIVDLATAHVLALDALDSAAERLVYNLGNGLGFSVREVLETARQVTGHPIPAVEGPRRPGDPPMLVASSEKIRRELGWEPRYPDLRTIMETAWEWRHRHPHGYV